MQAILTRFLPHTKTLSARVKATAQAGSVTIPWEYRDNPSVDHEEAAKALMKRFGWDEYYSLQGGCLPSGDYAWTLRRKRK